MIEIIEAPEQLPISLSLVKEHLRIIGVDDDPALGMYIPAAVEVFERFTGIALIEQKVRQVFGCFPDCEDYFLLERGKIILDDDHPLVIKYYDTSGTLKVWDAENYQVISHGLQPSVCVNSSKSWASDIHPTFLNAVHVEYFVGYGTNDLAVPMRVKQAISMLVGDQYNNREDTVISSGIGQLKVSWNSERFMQQFCTHFYEHVSQKRI